MASDLNRCEFIGRLGKDPETRYMQSGDPVTNFSIAVGEKWRDKNSGEMNEKTTWVNVVTFRKLAEICEKYLEKGSQVFIAGKLSVRKWQDKDGNDRYSTEIVASDMQMLGGKSEGKAQNQSGARKASKIIHPGEDFDDDIPF